MLNTMRILITLFILAFSISASGQSDCTIFFTYTWTVEPGTSNEIDLGLPTSQFLSGYKSDDDQKSFYFVGLTSSHEKTLVSHLSSDFCMAPDKIIDKIFKGDNSVYLLKLRTKKNTSQMKEIEIPIESIKFSFDVKKKQIIIQLPTIKTQ